MSPAGRARIAAVALCGSCAAVIAAAATAPPAATAPTAFRDCEGCPEMTRIPAGRYTMGSPGSEAGRSADEGPLRAVEVAAFALARHETTVAQFERFVRETGHAAPGRPCTAFDVRDGEFRALPVAGWRDPGYAQSADHPVVCVTWLDAQAYLRWLSTRTGRRYRLPSEAEWEYAARAGSGTSRPWGESAADACREANVADETFVREAAPARSRPWPRGWHACRDGHAYAAPVGGRTASRFGLHDLIGNVWEWVEDCYHPDYAGAPGDARPNLRGDCARRVYRGGAWRSYPERARAAHRAATDPAARHVLIGFRAAATDTGAVPAPREGR